MGKENRGNEIEIVIDPTETVVAVEPIGLEIEVDCRRPCCLLPCTMLRRARPARQRAGVGAINTWNGACLMFPDVTRHTLLSVLNRNKGEVTIGGQYWDSIVWTIGAWSQYLFTGDKEFLATALDAVTNTLVQLEETEFDPDLNLFRGAASSSDGVAGYPDVYAEPGGFSGISDWPRRNPDRRHPVGFGVPMHALSTKCFMIYLIPKTSGISLRTTRTTA